MPAIRKIQNFRRFILLAIFSTNIYAFIGQAYAKQINVVTEYFQTYQLKTDSGKLDGFAVEVVNLLFKKTKHSANIDVLPWSRAYKKALEERNAMIFSIAKTQARQSKFKWVGTLSREPWYVWGLKSKFTEKVADLETLKSNFFVVMRDTNPDEQLSKRGFTKIFRVASQQQMLGMIYKNRADLLVSNVNSMQYRTKSLGYDFSEFTAVYQFEDLTSDLSIAFNLDSDSDIIEDFRRAFIEIEQSGELASIKKKWNVRY